MAAATSDDAFDYARMMQRALRAVVRDSVGYAAEHGLPGAHHFYIGFDTRHPGVDMPDWLREQFPEDATLVWRQAKAMAARKRKTSEALALYSQAVAMAPIPTGLMS